MKAKRGVTIRWASKDALAPEHIPFSRTCIVIWKDRFGTVHVTGWGPDVDPGGTDFERAIRSVLVELNLNPIIEP